MSPEVSLLVTTAATLGLVHTAVGVDHTLPFVVLGRAKSWSLAKTLGITAACGLVHVLSSVLVGAVGWLLGVGLLRLEAFEAGRGSWAAWALIVFGFSYALVSFYRMRRGQAHRHVHVHSDGTIHSHDHSHQLLDGRVLHQHPHSPRGPLGTKRLVPVLLAIFFLGPCEALVPLMMAPGLVGDGWASALVALAFGASTLLTMVVLVGVGYAGLSFRSLTRLEPHLNWIAGVTIGVSGLGVQLLGI